MNAKDFIAAVKEMVGLRPDMIERLVTLAPNLSDTDRKNTIEQLTKSHEEIKKHNTALSNELDEGIAEMDKTIKTMKRDSQESEEKKEHASAEKILEDTSSTDDITPPFAA